MTHVFSMVLVLEMFIQTQVSCLICLIHLLGNNTGPYYIFTEKKKKTKIKQRNKPTFKMHVVHLYILRTKTILAF